MIADELNLCKNEIDKLKKDLTKTKVELSAVKTDIATLKDKLATSEREHCEEQKTLKDNLLYLVNHDRNLRQKNVLLFGLSDEEFGNVIFSIRFTIRRFVS